MVTTTLKNKILFFVPESYVFFVFFRLLKFIDFLPHGIIFWRALETVIFKIEHSFWLLNNNNFFLNHFTTIFIFFIDKFSFIL